MAPHHCFRCEAQAANVVQLRRKAEIVPVTTEISGVASHAEDDLVIAAAVSARAPYLVTGDAGLLAVGTHRGVSLVTARFFRTMLDQRRAAGQ